MCLNHLRSRARDEAAPPRHLLAPLVRNADFLHQPAPELVGAVAGKRWRQRPEFLGWLFEQGEQQVAQIGLLPAHCFPSDRDRAGKHSFVRLRREQDGNAAFGHLLGSVPRSFLSSSIEAQSAPLLLSHSTSQFEVERPWVPCSPSWMAALISACELIARCLGADAEPGPGRGSRSVMTFAKPTASGMTRCRLGDFGLMHGLNRANRLSAGAGRVLRFRSRFLGPASTCFRLRPRSAAENSERSDDHKQASR